MSLTVTALLSCGHPYPLPQQLLCWLQVEVIVLAHHCLVFPLALKNLFCSAPWQILEAPAEFYEALCAI